MRIEVTKGGRAILCGVILPINKIRVGQEWVGSSGHLVKVYAIKDKDQIYYKWRGRDVEWEYHDKDSFSFQCRYCLDVTGVNVSDWI